MGLRVLAAMSGGVDSATAAARAVDAGHDVTGVHLALSQNPQSLRTGARGCCTIEDARDARRAADALCIPFYVWDLAERFEREVVADFVAVYPGHYARLVDDPVTGARSLHRAVDPGKDQSYVLAVLPAARLGQALFPL